MLCTMPLASGIKEKINNPTPRIMKPTSHDRDPVARFSFVPQSLHERDKLRPMPATAINAIAVANPRQPLPVAALALDTPPLAVFKRLAARLPKLEAAAVLMVRKYTRTARTKVHLSSKSHGARKCRTVCAGVLQWRLQNLSLRSRKNLACSAPPTR